MANDIPINLRVPTQLSLDDKLFILNEVLLKDLGVDNNLAFTYFKGLRITCQTERTNYEWKEMEVDDIGLLPNNFTYPDNWIVNGIDYSNKEYNFVNTQIDIPIHGLQETLTEGAVALMESAGGIYVSNYKMSETDFQATNYSNYFGEVGSSIIESRDNLITVSNYYSDDAEETSTKGEIIIDKGLISITQYIDEDKKTKVEYETPVFDTTILIPAPPSGGVYKLALENQIPVIDGSETQINVGDNMTKSGNGTIANPFLLNSIPPTLQNGTTTVVSGDGFTIPYKIETKNLQKSITTSYTLLPADDGYSIKVNNGTTPITITVRTGLPANFFVGITQKGTGDITLVADSGVTLSNPTGLKIAGIGLYVGIEQLTNTNVFDVLGNTKA